MHKSEIDHDDLPESNASSCRRNVATVHNPHAPREKTPAHAKNDTNTSVKPSICNYISVRKDITQIPFKRHMSGTIMIVVH